MIPVVEQLLAVRVPAGWRVSWDGYERRLVAFHPNQATGIRIAGATPEELAAGAVDAGVDLAARVDAFLEER